MTTPHFFSTVENHRPQATFVYSDPPLFDELHEVRPPSIRRYRIRKQASNRAPSQPLSRSGRDVHVCPRASPSFSPSPSPINLNNIDTVLFFSLLIARRRLSDAVQQNNQNERCPSVRPRAILVVIIRLYHIIVRYPCTLLLPVLYGLYSILAIIACLFGVATDVLYIVRILKLWGQVKKVSRVVKAFQPSAHRFITTLDRVRFSSRFLKTRVVQVEKRQSEILGSETADSECIRCGVRFFVFGKRDMRPEPPPPPPPSQRFPILQKLVLPHVCQSCIFQTPLVVLFKPGNNYYEKHSKTFK